MRIDAQTAAHGQSVVEAALTAEAAGYGTLWVGETKHDPFLSILRAADATSSLNVGTSIAVAFSRNPMTIATTAYELAELAQGRFVLGLGSQVKAHIERRFSMPWSHPAPRMREFVAALRAIWSCWSDGTPLNFSGEFYTHTLMPPFFCPDSNEFGAPPVYLAGVGKHMTEVVGEVADGWFWHPFTTKSFLEDVSLPALERGRRRSLDRSEEIVITGPAFITTGRNDEEIEAAILGTKKQIAFYASTPTYRAVLEHHGWGDLQPQLTDLSKQGRWDEMAGLIHDDLLDAMSVVGRPEEAGAALKKRWEGVATSLTLYAPYDADPSVWPTVVEAIRG
jgi:probable F420-dependent oxidoreductase